MDTPSRFRHSIVNGDTLVRTALDNARRRREGPMSAGIAFNAPDVGPEEYASWQSQSLVLLKEVFGSEHDYTETFIRATESRGYSKNVRAGLGILKSALADLEAGHVKVPVPKSDSLDLVTNLCDRFHLVVRQLRHRHDQRETLDITDEYDVQDLMHSLLHLHFSDIRSEEWSPSYAGAASRSDFLLKSERIVVEVKKTRAGLNARKLGEELLIDMQRYQAHPDCGTLVCFVYDPDGKIGNPRGLEKDLEQDVPLKVRVLIRPL